MNRTYILATDGTETSKKAENFVIETLDSESTELLLVTVVEDIDEEQLEAVKEDINLETLGSRRKKEAERMLQQKVDRYEEAGFSVSTEVCLGEPGEEICTLAEDVDADGIFMGRGEHSKLGQFFYGSVSHYVLLNAGTTVIVSPSSATEDTDESDVDYRASRMDR